MMVVARDLAASVRAQREDVVEGAILRRARPSQRARRERRGERCGGVAGSGRGERRGMSQSDARAHLGEERHLNEKTLERRERAKFV